MGHKFKKQFGQNFLRNDRFVHELLAAANITAEDVIVEIGPGDGRVTNQLLQVAKKVISIEIDYSLIVKLVERFGDNPNFELIHEDVLAVSLPELQEKYGFQAYKIVGSLPYNISKQIIKKFIEIEQKPTMMAFIVQEEVAQDYVAQAPKASSLSNWIRLYADVRKFLTIPKSQFFPEPKVNGAILQIIPKSEIDIAHKEIAQLIRIGFTTPRKTLVNNLRTINDWQSLDWEQITAMLNLPITARAAELTLDHWTKLAAHLYGN